MNILNEMNAGNWITLASVAVGFVVGFARLKDHSDEHKRRIEQLEESREIDRQSLRTIGEAVAGIAATLSWLRDRQRDRERNGDG